MCGCISSKVVAAEEAIEVALEGRGRGGLGVAGWETADVGGMGVPTPHAAASPLEWVWLAVDTNLNHPLPLKQGISEAPIQGILQIVDPIAEHGCSEPEDVAKGCCDQPHHAP